MVPATIVAVLGYVSLRQWATSAELLFREQARDVAAMAVEKVEMQLRHADDAFLGQLQARVSSGSPGDGGLDDLVAQSSLIRHVYILDRRGRFLYPQEGRASGADVVGGLAERLPREFWDGGGRRAIIIGDQVLVTAILEMRGERVLVAFSRDLAALRREIFETTLGALESPTICAVLDHADRPVYSPRSLDGAERLLSASFREGLPRWQVAVFIAPGASPRATVRRQVALFTAAFSVLVAIIIAGIVLTWRLVRHEAAVGQLKADFVANVSHDLKTPVSVIRMFAETLEMGRVPDESRRQEYYRVITRESERLSRLIDNVLDFSRIERGRRTYNLVPTALEPLLRQTLEAFAYVLAQHAFKVETRIASDLPAVAIDADAIGQALANLIDNAIKYSGDGRSIRLEAEPVDGQVAISVADEGIGIPVDEQAKIFEKFYRVGRSDIQGLRGSGVGLAVVRHVAEAHRGRVTVESRPGEGSRFTLWIPLTGHA